MKKIIIILAVITTGLALLFAQPPAEPEEAVVEQTPASKPALKPIAQPVVPPAKPVPELPEPEPLPQEEVKTDEASLSGDLTDDALITNNRISLLMKNAELKEIIEVFSRLSRANIIVPSLSTDKKVDRKMDVNLNNVEWKPALEAVLESQNLELYEKIPGSEVFSIREKTPGAPEPTNVEVFKLKYASASSLTNVLVLMVGTNNYAVFPERNVVVAQSTAKNLLDLKGVIYQMDLPRQQVFIEAKFLELSDSATKKLGIDWQVLGGYNLGLKGIGGSYAYTDSKTDTITKSQESSVGNQSGENNYSDIEGKPYETLTEEPAGGIIEWPERPGNNPANVRTLGLTPTTFTENLSRIASEAGSSVLDEAVVARTLGATLSAADFGVVLAALNEVGGVKVVSNPKVIVANEETAMIHIGKKKPNVKGVIQTAGDSQLNRTYALDEEEPYFEDGIKVSVTPTVNTARNIAVKIQPTLDRLDILPYIAPDGTEFYGKSTKTINTHFSLESGQTAAIGGLTKTSSDNVNRKIPVLGTLPLVGRFFSYEETIDAQVETIIFVTVGLANPENIDMDTGLPTGARLTQRHQIQEAVDRQVSREELNVLRTKEHAELEKELKKLRAANQKLIEQQAEKDAKAVEKEAAEEAKAAEKEKAKADAVAAKLAKEEAAAQKLAEDIESEGRASSSAAAEAKAGEADPVAEDVSEVIAPVVAPVAELPVAEKTPSVEEIIESLEPAIEESGGGTATTNSTKSE